MKLPFSRPTTLADVGWFIAMCAGLWALFLLFQRLGFSTNYGMGLSFLALLVLIALGLIAQRQWLKLRWDRGFKGLSFEQQTLELDRVFEEQVAAGVVTRVELDEIRAKAKAKLERERSSMRINRPV